MKRKFLFRIFLTLFSSSASFAFSDSALEFNQESTRVSASGHDALATLEVYLAENYIYPVVGFWRYLHKRISDWKLFISYA